MGKKLTSLVLGASLALGSANSLAQREYQTQRENQGVQRGQAQNSRGNIDSRKGLEWYQPTPSLQDKEENNLWYRQTQNTEGEGRHTIQQTEKEETEDIFEINLSDLRFRRLNKEKLYIAEKHGVRFFRVSGRFYDVPPERAPKEGSYAITRYDKQKKDYVKEIIKIPYDEFPEEIRRLREEEQEIIDKRKEKLRQNAYNVNTAAVFLIEGRKTLKRINEICHQYYQDSKQKSEKK